MKKYILLFVALMFAAKTYHYLTQVGEITSPQEQQVNASTNAQNLTEDANHDHSSSNGSATSHQTYGKQQVKAVQDLAQTPQNVPRLHWWHSLQWITMLPIHSDTSGPAPEPATMFLFGTGMAGLVIITRKRIKK